jgi:hypothetical protein
MKKRSTLMHDAEVEDQAPFACLVSRVSQEVTHLHVAAQLAPTCIIYFHESGCQFVLSAKVRYPRAVLTSLLNDM